MNEEKRLRQELAELNRQLREIRRKSKFMIYSASPWKFAFFNFLAGIFHTLGALFGYLVVFSAIVFLLSRLDLTRLVSNWLNQVVKEVRWEQVFLPTRVEQQFEKRLEEAEPLQP